jgi:hypothetical protein
MFIDALGWEVVKKYDFMNEFKHRNKVKMQFGYSSTALPTILTGKKPKEHMHFTLFKFNLDNSPFRNVFTNIINILPSFIERNWRIRSRISSLLKKSLGWTGYFQLYSLPIKKLIKLDVAEKRDIFKKNGISEVENIYDVLEKNHIPFHISDYNKSEEENITELKGELNNGKIEFAFLYTAMLDSLLHTETIDGENIQSKLSWYEDKIKEILNEASLSYDEVEFMILSDHGMTTHKKSVDIKSYLESMQVKEGKDYEVLLDSTMARFLITNQEAELEIKKALASCSGEFLSSEKLTEWGCDFESSEYGDLIYLVNPGVQIVPSDMGRKSLPGMHGYTPEHEDSYAAFLSNRKPSNNPLWVGDFFNLMVGEWNI